MLQTQTFFTAYYIIIGTAAMLFFVIFFYLFFLQMHRRRTIHEKEMYDLKAQYERTLFQSQLEIQEQTFRNISQEIHDNIGQVLSLAKLNLNTMDCNNPEALQVKINDSKQLISKAIQDLRDLSRSLNTDYVVEMG